MISVLMLLLWQATPEAVAQRDAAELQAMLVGRWNNTEAVSFAKELETEAPEHAHLTAEEGEDGALKLRLRTDGEAAATLEVKAEGGAVSGTLKEGARSCAVTAKRSGETFSLTAKDRGCLLLPRGEELRAAQDELKLPGYGVLNRADAYTCWASRKKPDGAWTWAPDLALHEGEYRQLEDRAGMRPAGIKLRHVRWPYGRNRDSFVLYVHEAEDEPAVSYVWGEPDAARLAVNLRYIQVSCTRVEAGVS